MIVPGGPFDFFAAVSKTQITFKGKARAGEKAQHTREYVSTLKGLAIPQLDVRCIFEVACKNHWGSRQQSAERRL